MTIDAVRCQSDSCRDQQQSDAGGRSAELAIVQSQQQRKFLSDSANASSSQDSGDKCIILNIVGSIFGCFSVADVAVAAETDEIELHCRCNVGNSLVESTKTEMQVILELRNGWWAVWPDISSVIGDGAKTRCCFSGLQHQNTFLAKRECQFLQHQMCSIHEIRWRDQKTCSLQYPEIVSRNSTQRRLNQIYQSVLIFPKSKLRKYD